MQNIILKMSSYLLSGLMFILLTITPVKTEAQTTTSEEQRTSYPSYKIGGFLQQQFITDQTAGSADRFTIHRARIGVSGDITERIKVNFIGGYAEPPNNTPRLVNAFVDFDLHPLLQLRAGQFLLPFGLEGPEPIILNPAIERSTAIRRLNTFTMFRDIGVQVSGQRSIFSYAAAVVNGAGANQTDQADPKDLMGRFGIRLADDLSVGASGHMGEYQPDPASGDHQSRYRFGLDISYTGNPLFLRGEYIHRQDDLGGGNSVKMNGGYLLGGYKVTDDLQAIARIEYFEPGTAADDEKFTGFTLGANYYFEGHTRLSVNYEVREDELNPALGNMLTVQMQVAL